MLENYFSKKKPDVEDIVRYVTELGGRRPAVKRFPARPAAFGSFGYHAERPREKDHHETRILQSARANRAHAQI